MKSRSVGEILAQNIPQPKELIGEGVLNVGNKLVLYGKPKTLKSAALKRLMLNLADGTDWLGFHTVKARTLYVQLELTEYEVQSRLRLMEPTKGAEERCKIWTTGYLKLDTPGGMEELDKEIEESCPELVIIDPIYKVLSGDMLKAVTVMPLLDHLDLLLAKYPIGIVLAHHQRKGAMNDKRGAHDQGAEEMAGAFLFSAWPDTVIGVKRRDVELVFTVDFARNARKDFAPVRTRIDSKLEFAAGYPPMFRV